MCRQAAWSAEAFAGYSKLCTQTRCLKTLDGTGEVGMHKGKLYFYVLQKVLW